ncbi:MAG: SRPBCC family protein [Candidatus Dormibacteraceae bacterium]
MFAYLLDVNKIAGCVPGAELSEVVDPNTFAGKVKIKVGPITVAYSGTARIVNRNDAERSATIEAEGRETTGPGSARAKALMSVEPDGAGSVVKIVTDYSVAGRVAQFGRGVMEDISRRIVNEMAACIKANVESAEPGGHADGPGPGPGPRAGAGAPSAAAATSKPINAFGLLLSVFWARLTGRKADHVDSMEPLDAGTAGIGAMLGLSAVIGLGLGAAVVISGLNAILASG